MLAFLVVIGFMLAVLAHVKLFITNRALIAVYDALSLQISARPAVIDADAPKLVVVPEVLPNPPHFVDAVILQWFYALGETFRARLFHDVAGIAKLEPSALSDLYNAAYGGQNMERSMSFQSLLRRVDAPQYAVLKQAVENAIADQKASEVVREAKPGLDARESMAPQVAQEPVQEAQVENPTMGLSEPELPAVVEAKKKRASKSRARTALSAPLDASL